MLQTKRCLALGLAACHWQSKQHHEKPQGRHEDQDKRKVLSEAYGPVMSSKTV